jgi:uncharacterized protein (TIGR03084 family)
MEPSTPVAPAVVALEQQQQELVSIIDALDDAQWRAATCCEGWNVTDVVLHLAQTNELAVGSLEDRFTETAAALMPSAAPPTGGSVDDGVSAMVAAEPNRDPAAVRARFHDAAARLRAAFAATDLHTRVRWVAGTLSARTLAATRLAETWIHTTDVAGAVGVTLIPDDRLEHVARLAWRTLPYAFSRAGRTMTGPVEFTLTAPSGALWRFTPDEPTATVVTGDGVELCLVAGRRLDPAATSLRAEGPDAAAVLELVRTYA